MDITVNVDNISLDSIVGEHRVYDPEDGYSTEPQTLGEAVAAQLAEQLRNSAELSEVRHRFNRMRDEEIRQAIREAVQPLIETTLTEGLQLTNSYGEPTGKATTLRELIVKQANDYFKQRSDKYNSNSERTIDKLVRQSVEDAIKKELADAVADEKAKVVAAVRAKASELIAQAVRDGVGR